MNSITIPQITCVIPTFNREKLLEEAIHSILDQTFSDWELIVVDNGSTDKTIEIVTSFQRNDKRISYYKCNRKGPSAARNYGVLKARGKYITFLDDDDISLPHRFETQLAAVIKSGKEFVVSGYEVRDRSDGRLIQRKVNELNGFGAGFPSRWIISKALFEKVGGFDEELIAMEDPEFSYRIAKYEIFAYHAKVVTIMYSTLESLSTKPGLLEGKVLMMKKAIHGMHPREAAWWYYVIGMDYYRIKEKEAAAIYFKKSVDTGRRTFHKISYLFFLFIDKYSGFGEKLIMKILNGLSNIIFSKIVNHPVIR